MNIFLCHSTNKIDGGNALPTYIKCKIDGWIRIPTENWNTGVGIALPSEIFKNLNGLWHYYNN